MVAHFHLEGWLGWFFCMPLLVLLWMLYVQGAYWRRSSCQQHRPQPSTR